jgi:cytochrome c oxidase subunit 2
VRHTRRLRWAAIPIAAALTLVLAGCSTEQLHGYLPGFIDGQKDVTTMTSRVSGLWVTSWIVLLIVGIIVWALIIWCVIVYRRRKGQTGLPVQLRYNMPIEIFYTIVPFILIIGFFAFTAQDQDAIEKPYAHPDLQVTVYGKQWAWDWDYTTSGAFDPGIQAQKANNAAQPDTQGNIDESQLPTLYLPVDQKIDITLKSRDVIHSFWVPAFLYKKDVIPGHVNHMYVTPTRIGTYNGDCAELCGEYHSAMLFRVKVVSQADYDAHIADLKAQGYSGSLGNDFDRNQNLPGNGTDSHETSNKTN